MLTWTCFSYESAKASPTPIYHYFPHFSAWLSRARTLAHVTAVDLSILLEWLLLKSIDDSKLPLYGQGDFRFMRKVKVYYSSMAAKGLSHFFQKDKVDEIATRFVCTIFTVGKDSVLCFRIIIVFVLLIIVYVVQHLQVVICRNPDAFCLLKSLTLTLCYFSDLPSQEEVRRGNITLRITQTVQGTVYKT